MGEIRNTNIYTATLKRGGNLGDEVVDGRMILKYFLDK
jgi:hypothetical protein